MFCPTEISCSTAAHSHQWKKTFTSVKYVTVDVLSYICVIKVPKGHTRVKVQT